MNKKTLLVALAGSFVFCGALVFAETAKDSSEKDDSKTKLQTTCPVMGGRINKKLFVDYQGKRIYVCCSGCIKKLKDNPEKYIKKLEEAGVVLAKAKNDGHEKAKGAPLETKRKAEK